MTSAAGSSGGLTVGSLFCDRYRVVREIKSGAMGAVYEVLDERTNAPCAMKVLLPSLLHRPEQRARFIQEATVTGGIESEHIVRVFDAGVAAETPYLVMELLRGSDLQDQLDQHGKLQPEEVCAHVAQAARALDKTAAASVVHRDIKPANLFVARYEDRRPCLKILDFGIAKIVADGGTDQTGVVGTFAFMAPEQINGSGRIDGRVDSYALAHTTYALLTGEPYWEEDAPTAGRVLPLMMKIIAGPKEPASARAARRTKTVLPPGFDAWFAKATAIDAAARYASASSLADDLGRLFRIAPGDAAPSGFATESTQMPSMAMESTHLPARGGAAELAPTASAVGPVTLLQPARTVVQTTLLGGQLAPALRSDPKPSRPLLYVLVGVASALVGLVGVALAFRRPDRIKRPPTAESATPTHDAKPSSVRPVASAQTAPPSSRPAPYCHPHIACAWLDASDLAAVEPSLVLASATELARGHLPGASAYMLSITAGLGPNGVDLRGDGSMMVYYQAKGRAFAVLASGGVLRLMDIGPLDAQTPLPPLQCDAARLWQALIGAGARSEENQSAALYYDTWARVFNWHVTSMSRSFVLSDSPCIVTSSTPLR